MRQRHSRTVAGSCTQRRAQPPRRHSSRKRGLLQRDRRRRRSGRSSQAPLRDRTLTAARSTTAPARMVCVISWKAARRGDRVKLPWLTAADAATHHCRCPGLPSGPERRGLAAWVPQSALRYLPKVADSTAFDHLGAPRRPQEHRPPPAAAVSVAKARAHHAAPTHAAARSLGGATTRRDGRGHAPPAAQHGQSALW